MTVLTIYSDNLKVLYKSRLFSKSTVFVFFTTMISVILPLIIAYKTKGFWQKTYVTLEHPYVTFSKQYLFMAEMLNGDPIICSSFQTNYTFIQDLNECSSFEYTEHDYDSDGKIDSFNFEINVDVPENNQFETISLILSFDVNIFFDCIIHFEGLAIFNQISPPFIFDGGVIQLMGSLKLNQDRAFACRKNNYKNLYNVEEDISILKSIEDYNIYQFIQQYYSRDLTTVITNSYVTWIKEQPSKMKIKAILKIPESQFIYQATFLQLFKWAWVQYLAIAVIIMWFFNYIKHYVFSKQILMTWNLTSSKKNL